MESIQFPKPAPTNEIGLQAPDKKCRVPFVEVSLGRSLEAFVRRRPKRRVWVGTKPIVEAVVDTSRRLSFQLQALRLTRLAEALEKNFLDTSPGLSGLVATAESKVAITLASEPPVEQGEPQ